MRHRSSTAAVCALAAIVAGCAIDSEGLLSPRSRDAGPGDAGRDASLERTVGDDTFEDFSAGDLGHSRANLYVRADGTVAPVLSGDANDDGHADVVVPWYSSAGVYEIPSRVYLGLDGSFDPARYLELPTAGAIQPLMADLNGDGHTDVAFTNHFSPAFAWAHPSVVYWGSSDGFTTHSDLSTFAAHAMDAADLDRDGWLDLVVTSYEDMSTTTPGVRVFFGGPEGFADARRIELPAIEIIDVCIADFDQDGWLDLFLPRIYSHMTGRFDVASQLVRFVDGEPQPPELYPTVRAIGCSVADLDVDGDLDVLVAQYADAAGFAVPSVVFLGAGGLPSTTETISLDVRYPSHPRIADFDRNGRLDVLVPQSWTGSSRSTVSPILFGGPSGLMAPMPFLASESPLDADVRDFDRDGRPDVLLGSYTDDALSYGLPQRLYQSSPAGLSTTASAYLPGSRTARLFPRDWGNTWDRGDRETFVSRPLDLGPGARPIRVAFRTKSPLGTHVRLQVRSADTPEGLADASFAGPSGALDWFDASPADIPPMHAGHRYLQYRAEFEFDAAGGPSLESVTFTVR